MAKKSKKRKQEPSNVRSRAVGVLLNDTLQDLCCEGYVTLDKCPEIMTAVETVASLIGSITIHLMENSDNGYNERIINELSRTVDIYPDRNMTRQSGCRT